MPGIQVYVAAPLEVIVAEAPRQMEDGSADAVTAGVGLTVTSTLAVPVQPLALVPVTE